MTVFRVGDRVNIKWDTFSNGARYWDGPGTVVMVGPSYVHVVCDKDGRNNSGKEGGFLPENLTLIEYGNLRDKVWNYLTESGHPQRLEFLNVLVKYNYLYDGICDSAVKAGINRYIKEASGCQDGKDRFLKAVGLFVEPTNEYTVTVTVKTINGSTTTVRDSLRADLKNLGWINDIAEIEVVRNV